ncbi:MAG TPA: hypothetical protein VFQ80_07495 [Thermomicrobiales bacterium]|jgi:hypothetical protein|nr:hypothetical protein [Thermomicrobiales bacterium]
MPRALVIDGLAWDEENEAHVARRADPNDVADMIANGTFEIFPNPKFHPQHYWRVIGLTASGKWLTAVLQQPDDGTVGIWRPVTAWPATDFEVSMFRRARGRRKRRSQRDDGSR